MEYIILACNRLHRKKGKGGKHWYWIIFPITAKDDEEAMLKFWSSRTDRTKVHVYAVFTRQSNFLVLRYFSPFVIVANDAVSSLKEIVKQWEKLLNDQRRPESSISESIPYEPNDQAGADDPELPGSPDLPVR
jgi:hypothetical protein